MVSSPKSLSTLLNPFGLNPALSASGWAALSAGVLYAGTCLALYHNQRKLIFRPLPTLIRTPADLGLPYQDVWMPAEDGGSLHGWWLPHPHQAPYKQKVLLFCHGNYGNISYNTERIRFFYSLGFSVLAFDYRGYGKSISGSASEAPIPSEESTYADAQAAWRYLVQERGTRPEQITTLGHSIGGAIAIHLATQPIARDMARLIIESSFTSMEDAVRAKRAYNLFPISQLLSESFDSLSKVAALPMPVLYVHGDQDFDVPLPMSKRLYAASPEPKRLWVAPGAGHNNICIDLRDRYADVIESFCAAFSTESTAQSAKKITSAPA